MKIGLVHYSYPPTVGGVETILRWHAHGFARRGHEVTVVCGSGRSDLPGVTLECVPELKATHEACLKVQSQLLNGELAGDFPELKSLLARTLLEKLRACDLVFIHNVLTMPFNMAATAALWEICGELKKSARVVSWVHDVAALNRDHVYPWGQEPWNLLIRVCPAVQPFAVSEHRRDAYCELGGIPPEACQVIPNGIDPMHSLSVTANVESLCRQFGLLNRDIVLLHPARILRRKNIDLGIRVAAAIKAAGRSVAYVVTGAPDPHQPASKAYGRELKDLVQQMRVDDSVIFAGDYFTLKDVDISSLYTASDAVFFPSREEGFGLPILEGAIAGLPVFCCNRSPMKDVATDYTYLVNPDDTPEALAAQVMRELAESPRYRARKNVIARYEWDRLFDEKIASEFLS